jgi:cytochrome P450
MLFDPIQDGVPPDPYPLYDRLRREDPVHRSGTGRWLLTRYEDCWSVLRHPAMSTAQRQATSDSDEAQLLAAYLSNLMLFNDPPDHTRLRGLVNKAFTPRVIERLHPRITELVDELLDVAAEAGSIDIIAELGRPLPVTVIAEMLGVPAEDQGTFRGWSEKLAHTVDPNMEAETAARAAEAGIEFMAYFTAMAEERRQHPQDDLLSGLVAAEEEGDRLSADELVTNCILLLIAGHETTTNLIGNGTLALLQNPDEISRWRADPTLAKTAVEELLRFDSPVHLTARTAMQDVIVGETEIKAGETLSVLLAAANRDPAEFAEPAVLDIGRTENRHLAFSSGPHFCLGAALARAEGQITLTGLITRFPNLELTVDQLEWNPTTTLRGLRVLPLSV